LENSLIQKEKTKVPYERRSRQGIMLAYPFEEKRLLKWPKPWLIQPKHDGLRCRAVIKNGEAVLYSSTGLVIETAPHILAELESFPSSLTAVLDGELYLPDSRSFQELTSIINRGSVHPSHRRVKYIVFDQISQEIQSNRLIQADSLISGLQFAESAPIALAESMADIEYILQESVSHGYEGIILRHPHALYAEKRVTTMMKWKPRHSDYYEIIGVQEEISIHGEPKGSLGALIVADDDSRIFNVGTGFTKDQRSQLWQDQEAIIGRLVHVKYQALSDGKIPRFPVFAEII
jgi:ATP-dependent DNA ligase